MSDLLLLTYPAGLLQLPWTVVDEGKRLLPLLKKTKGEIVTFTKKTKREIGIFTNVRDKETHSSNSYTGLTQRSISTESVQSSGSSGGRRRVSLSINSSNLTSRVSKSESDPSNPPPYCSVNIISLICSTAPQRSP